MKRPFLVHPFLFGMFPILSLFLHNINEAPLSIILVPTVIVIGFTILLLYLSKRIFRNRIKAGIVASIFLILFFIYGSFSQLTKLSTGKPADWYLMPVFFLLLIIISYIVKKICTPLLAVTKIFNFLATFLILFLLINIGAYKLKTLDNFLDYRNTKKTQAVMEYSKTTNTLPDIYYIILDRYANESILRKIYNFDNSYFINQLSKRGFYVAAQSNSNYLKTAHSLASSLNMKYINYLKDKIKGPSDNYLPIQKMLQDYKVWRFLKSQGYQFIHFGSWWPPDSKNKFADRNVNLDFPSEDFINILYRSSILYPILKTLGYPQNFRQWKRVIYKFDKLSEIPNIKEPTFVFAHMLIPHPPYVFDRYGNFLSEEIVAKRRNKENYIGQLIFTNKKVINLIDKLISNSEVFPIIVLQADEGPFPKRYNIKGRHFNWKKASKMELKQKMGILNAYYLPNLDKNVLYPSITPVNSFRIIFNHYFNTHFELLPDKCYAFVDGRHPYSFFDITDLINSECSSKATISKAKS